MKPRFTNWKSFYWLFITLTFSIAGNAQFISGDNIEGDQIQATKTDWHYLNGDNIDGNGWHERDSALYFYQDGRIVEILMLRLKEGNWQNRYKKSYHYETNREIVELSFYEAGKWEGSDQEVKGIKDGNIISLTYIFERNGNLENSHQFLYEYDERGNETLDLRQEWRSGAWIDYRKYITEYDTLDNITYQSCQEWKSNQWNLDWECFYTYQYDVHGNLIFKSSIYSDIPSTENILMYDSLNRILSDTRYQLSNSTRTLLEETVYNYNQNGFIDSITSRDPNRSFRYNFLYNSLNQQIERHQLYLKDGAWNLSGKTTYSYDANHNLQEINDGFFLDGIFQDDQFPNFQFEYNQDNSLITKTTYNYWTDSGPNFSTALAREKTYYLNPLSVSTQDQIKVPEAVLLFPNPTNTSLNFELKQLENFFPIVASIYTTKGQFIKSVILYDKAGHLSVNDLNNGIYFLQLSTEKRTFVKAFAVKRN